jgi:hypothetical protein
MWIGDPWSLLDQAPQIYEGRSHAIRITPTRCTCSGVLARRRDDHLRAADLITRTGGGSTHCSAPPENYYLSPASPLIRKAHFSHFAGCQTAQQRN